MGDFLIIKWLMRIKVELEARHGAHALKYKPLSEARAFSYHLGESRSIYVWEAAAASAAFLRTTFRKMRQILLFSDKDCYTGVFCFRVRIQCLLDDDEDKPLNRTKVWKGVIFLTTQDAKCPDLSWSAHPQASRLDWDQRWLFSSQSSQKDWISHRGIRDQGLWGKVK